MFVNSVQISLAADQLEDLQTACESCNVDFNIEARDADGPGIDVRLFFSGARPRDVAEFLQMFA